MKILNLLKFGKLEKIERETPAPQESRRVRLGLIVGHDSKERGARLGETNSFEYDYNMQVAIGAKQYADQMFSFGVDVEVILRDRIGIAGAYKKADELNCDFVIELHFNAFNKQVRGTETLTSADLDSRNFAAYVHERMLVTFDRRHGSLDRGVKVLSKTDRGGKNVYAFRGPSCLVEPFFGDSEAELGLVRLNAYSRELVYLVKNYAMKIGLLPT